MTQPQKQASAKNTLIFIPDIGGLTKFVKVTHDRNTLVLQPQSQSKKIRMKNTTLKTIFSCLAVLSCLLLMSSNTFAQSTQPTYFYIKNAKHQMGLVAGLNYDKQVYHQNLKYGLHEQWKFEPAGDGYYYIIDRKHNRALYGIGKKKGRPQHLAKRDTDLAKWKITANKNSGYIITNKVYGDLVAGNNPDNKVYQSVHANRSNGRWELDIALKGTDNLPFIEDIVLPLYLWKPPVPSIEEVVVTKSQFRNQVFEITQDEEFSKKVTTMVFERLSEGLGATEAILSASVLASKEAAKKIGNFLSDKALEALGPIGALIDAVISLGIGTEQIVQKVRAENGTSFALYNVAPGLRVHVEDVDGFNKNFAGEKGMESMDRALSAYAEAGANAIGGMAFQMAPYRSGGFVKGTIKLQFRYKDKTWNADLAVRNSIGAGVRSVYSLKGDSFKDISVESRDRETVSVRTTTVNGLKIALSLKHADHKTQKGQKDQRKDIVEIYVVEDAQKINTEIEDAPPVPETKSVIVSLKNSGGYRAKYTVKYTDGNGKSQKKEITSKGAPWNQDYTIKIKKGTTYSITAVTVSGKKIKAKGGISKSVQARTGGTVLRPTMSIKNI